MSVERLPDFALDDGRSLGREVQLGSGAPEEERRAVVRACGVLLVIERPEMEAITADGDAR